MTLSGKPRSGQLHRESLPSNALSPNFTQGHHPGFGLTTLSCCAWTSSVRLEVSLKQPSQLLKSLLTATVRIRADAEFSALREMLGLDEIEMFLLGKLVQHSGDESACVGGVGAHVAHDHLDRDVFIGRVPALQVGQ
jgi:hypothetical protein